MAVEVSRSRFDALVDRAIASIPGPLLDAADNVAIDVADRNDEEPTLLGLYNGIALTERDTEYTWAVPDSITIYRYPMQEIVADEDELEHQIRVTVVHELAHHFGIDDARLHELGWG